MAEKNEKRYYVTSNVTFKLAPGAPAVISNNQVIQNALPPVLVTLPHLVGGSEGYTVARVRKLAEMTNRKDRVDALKDSDIEKALDELMARSPSVWSKAEYIERTRGKEAAKDNKEIETLAKERNKLAEENERLAAEIAKMKGSFQKK